MSTPIDQIVQWYESLPVANRQDIAFLLCGAMPGFESVDTTDANRLPELFVQTIRAHQAGLFLHAGLALALRECIDYILKRRSNRSDFQQVKQDLQQAATDKNNETFARMAREVDFKAEQWIKTWEKWKAIKATHLSTDAIEAHEDARARDLSRPQT